MPEISIVQKSDVDKARRFDAEYFKPEYLEIERKLNSLKTEKIKEIFYPVKNGIDYRNFEERGTIYYIRTGDIQDDGFKETAIKINFSNIPNKVKLRENDILFTRKGNYGKNCLVFDGIKNSLISSEIMLLRKKHNTFSHAYLSIFLRSKFGSNQIERNVHGVSNFSITQEALENIKIPSFTENFQLQIEGLVKEAHQKQAQSKQLYQEAEQILLEELGLLDFEIRKPLTFATTKKEVDQAKRFDAEYFQPKYTEIIQKIENYKGGFDVVLNQFKQNKTLSKKNEAFYNYIEISDVNVSNGEIVSNKIGSKNIPANGKRKLFINDLLVSKVRPYRGAVSFIDFETESLLGSGAFTILQEKTEYKKEVLMIFLKTIFIKELLLRYNCGTSYPVIKDEDILNLKIPLIDEKIQTKIANKITQSHALRKESKALLETAKRTIEDEIEKKTS